jgi:hypothetical protein
MRQPSTGHASAPQASIPQAFAPHTATSQPTAKQPSAPQASAKHAGLAWAGQLATRLPDFSTKLLFMISPHFLFGKNILNMLY